MLPETNGPYSLKQILPCSMLPSQFLPRQMLPSHMLARYLLLRQMLPRLVLPVQMLSQRGKYRFMRNMKTRGIHFCVTLKKINYLVLAQLQVSYGLQARSAWSIPRLMRGHLKEVEKCRVAGRLKSQYHATQGNHCEQALSLHLWIFTWLKKW